MKLDRLLQFADEERSSRMEGHEADVVQKSADTLAAVKEALEKLGVTEISSPRDIFEYCEAIDQLSVDPQIEGAFQQTRTVVLGKALLALNREKIRALKPGQLRESVEIDRNKRLWFESARLIAVLKQHKPDIFGPTWIQTCARDIYEKMLPLITNTEGQAQWQEVRSLLPKSWADKFLNERKLSKDEMAARTIDEYREVAEALGPEALAEFLISIGKAPERDFSKMLRIIAQYLGRTEKKALDFHGFSKIPEEALSMRGFRKLVFVKLRNHIYRELLKTADFSEMGINQKLDQLLKSTRGILAPEKRAHEELLAEVFAYYSKILRLKTPSRLKSKIKDKAEGDHEIPSLRQRMAMDHMERDPEKGKNGRGLICFPAGKGKTAGAFLAKEHVGAKKMLYLCPNEALVNQTASRVEKYYKKEEMPTVGKIVAGMSEEEIEIALQQEIVIVPFSMLKAKRGGQTVTEMIKAEKFDFMTVDEAHNARKEEGAYTEAIFDIATGVKDLYEKGHIMLLSANPTPNTPDDIVTQLRLYDKETYGNTGSLREIIRRLDPLIVRNNCLDFILNPDEPEAWQEHIEYVTHDLSDEEAHIYATIVDDEQKPLIDKIRDLRRCHFNPQLYDASFETEGTLAKDLAARLWDDLEKKDTIMIGETSYKEGFTRPDKHQPDVPTFVQNVENLLGQKCKLVAYERAFKTRQNVLDLAKEAKRAGEKLVITAIYDGDTPQNDRDDMMNLSREAKALGIKVLIFGITPTVREGQDLSHMDIAYLLCSEYNHPDLYQFLKRFLRELNTQAKVRVYTSPATILEGIYLHAEQKNVLCNRFLHGGTLVEKELEIFEDANETQGLEIKGGKVVFGTAIMDRLLSRKQKLAKAAAYFHNKGAEEYQRVMSHIGPEFAAMYSEDWEKSHSSSNARLTAGIITKLQQKRELMGMRFADVACGPLALVNTLGLAHPEMDIDSFDVSPHMLNKGFELYRKRGGSLSKFKGYAARMTALEKEGIMVSDGSYDLVNIADALQLTHLHSKKIPLNDERVQALIEQNRILKTGGVLILTFQAQSGREDEFKNLSRELGNFGFRTIEKYTGYATHRGNSGNFRNYTIVCEKVGAPNVPAIDLSNLKLTSLYVPVAGKSAPGKSGLHTEFALGKTEIDFATEYDRSLLAAEKAHQMMLQSAQSALKILWRSKGHTFSNLTKDERRRLSLLDIKLIPPEGNNSWRFTMGRKTDLYAFSP